MARWLIAAGLPVVVLAVGSVIAWWAVHAATDADRQRFDRLFNGSAEVVVDPMTEWVSEAELVAHARRRGYVLHARHGGGGVDPLMVFRCTRAGPRPVGARSRGRRPGPSRGGLGRVRRMRHARD